ncbi:MAG: S49 family peptidase, partial [Alphaproteobacteria bacterium]
CALPILIDGIGDLKSVLRGKFGDKVRLPVVGAEKSWLQRRLGLSTQFSAVNLPADMLAAAEVRAQWARYGL